jgi:hypothetical protein
MLVLFVYSGVGVAVDLTVKSQGEAHCYAILDEKIAITAP